MDRNLQSSCFQTADPIGHCDDVCHTYTPATAGLGRRMQASGGQDLDEMAISGGLDAPYEAVLGDVSKIIDAGGESASRSVNADMTAAYWLIGRRIVEFEQSGEERAEYGAALTGGLAEDLTGRFGRGSSSQDIYNMRQFYLSYQPDRILQTLSGKFDAAPACGGFWDIPAAFPLP